MYCCCSGWSFCCPSLYCVQHIARVSERLVYKCEGLTVQPGSAAAATLAAEAADYDAALLAGTWLITDPAAAAAATEAAVGADLGEIPPYINVTETGAEVQPAQAGVSDASEYGRRLHHHHHHHHHHQRHLTALLNTDELPSPWKVSTLVCGICSRSGTPSVTSLTDVAQYSLYLWWAPLLSISTSMRRFRCGTRIK
jgi:hypothetical protein